MDVDEITWHELFHLGYDSFISSASANLSKRSEKLS